MSALAQHQGEPRFTYGDYVQWNNDDRWELIDGVPYNMSPSPTRRHQGILLTLATQIRLFLEGKPCKVYVAPFDVRLPEASEPDEEVLTVVQPDIVVVCDPSKLDDKGCRGAPDFIVEIVSPSTSARDQVTKTALYERHGVKEYWLIHPIDNLLTIRLLGTDGKYGAPLIREGKGRAAVSVLPGLDVDLDATFAT